MYVYIYAAAFASCIIILSDTVQDPTWKLHRLHQVFKTF